MSFNAKPAEIPYWATDDIVDPISEENNVVIPPELKQQYGWDYLEKPPRNYFNWLHRWTYRWIDYFNQFFSSTHQLKINEIIEEASDGGVTIDGVLLKDNTIEAQALGDSINAAAAKTTPVDADMLGLMDSAASNILKKLSWANVKAVFTSFFVTLTGNQTITGVKTFSDRLIASKGRTVAGTFHESSATTNEIYDFLSPFFTGGIGEKKIISGGMSAEAGNISVWSFAQRTASNIITLYYVHISPVLSSLNSVGATDGGSIVLVNVTISI